MSDYCCHFFTQTLLQKLQSCAQCCSSIIFCLRSPPATNQPCCCQYAKSCAIVGYMELGKLLSILAIITKEGLQGSKRCDVWLGYCNSWLSLLISRRICSIGPVLCCKRNILESCLPWSCICCWYAMLRAGAAL